MMDISNELKFLIAALAVSLAIAVLAVAANAVDGRRLPAQQPGMKTAPVTQPQHQGIAQPYQPTINPTVLPTVMPTIPPPTPTRMIIYPTIQAGPAEPPVGPTVRHAPLPSVQEGPAEPLRWPTHGPKPSFYP